MNGRTVLKKREEETGENSFLTDIGKMERAAKNQRTEETRKTTTKLSKTEEIETDNKRVKKTNNENT